MGTNISTTRTIPSIALTKSPILTPNMAEIPKDINTPSNIMMDILRAMTGTIKTKSEITKSTPESITRRGRVATHNNLRSTSGAYAFAI